MPLIVGNLLTDPSAQSFISLADAEEHISVEAAASRPVAAWMALTTVQKEGSLVVSSRWLATVFKWCVTDLTEAELLTVGRVAVRVSTATYGTMLYGSSSSAQIKKRVRAGTTEVEYADVASAYSQAQSGGNSWPWIDAMLRGLICDPRNGLGVMVV